MKSNQVKCSTNFLTAPNIQISRTGIDSAYLRYHQDKMLNYSHWNWLRKKQFIQRIWTYCLFCPFVSPNNKTVKIITLKIYPYLAYLVLNRVVSFHKHTCTHRQVIFQKRQHRHAIVISFYVFYINQAVGFFRFVCFYICYFGSVCSLLTSNCLLLCHFMSGG